MSRRRNVFPFVVLGTLVLASNPVFGQSALGLSVNGQLVVPVGQLESFDYHLADSRIDAKTFYGDVRCAQLDPSQSGTDGLVFNLDRLTNKEDEASYQVFSDGSIEYDTGAGMINVLTSDGASAPDCVHFIEVVGTISATDGEATPGTFWAGNFESPIRLESKTCKPAVIGDKLTIRFTITNTSALLVATDIQAPFASSISITDGITGPDYTAIIDVAGATGVCDAAGDIWESSVANDLWEIPILWPGKSAVVDVSYILDLSVEPGVEIETTADILEASDRRDSSPLAISTPLVTVMETSTAGSL